MGMRKGMGRYEREWIGGWRITQGDASRDARDDGGDVEWDVWVDEGWPWGMGGPVGDACRDARGDGEDVERDVGDGWGHVEADVRGDVTLLGGGCFKGTHQHTCSDL